MAAIGRRESEFEYSVGPQGDVKPRCGPTICFPYAISTERMQKYAPTQLFTAAGVKRRRS